jgi:hypothetical protein
LLERAGFYVLLIAGLLVDEWRMRFVVDARGKRAESEAGTE